MEKILLDTDIGSDIDDAVCLAYLLAQPACELLGITTVSGDTALRAQLASVLCKVAGKDVPIYPGISLPLVISEMQPHVPQAKALPRWPHEMAFPEEKAVEFLARSIREHPREVTLLAIGPLTNVATLFRLHPDTPGLLKELVIMGGVFGGGLKETQLEWNMRCDPHAAAEVFKTRIPRHRSVGLDVTMQVQMPAQEVREKFTADLLKPVADFAEAWFEHSGLMTFHDPLAAAAIFDPEICSFEKGRAEVNLEDQAMLGYTAFVADADEAPHEVATSVDKDRFFRHYFGTFRPNP